MGNEKSVDSSRGSKWGAAVMDLPRALDLDVAISLATSLAPITALTAIPSPEESREAAISFHTGCSFSISLEISDKEAVIDHVNCSSLDASQSSSDATQSANDHSDE